MANSFSASFTKVWAKEQETIFYKKNVGTKIADLSFKSQLKKGNTFTRTYRSANNVQQYTRGTDITIDDKTDTEETLVVNKQFATGFYVDDFDAIQNDYDAAANYGKDDGIYLANQVDADILGEVSNAISTVDDGTIGGTSGNGITVTTSNILAVFSAAKKKLRKQNVPVDELFAVVSPEVEDVLVQYGAGRDTTMGDQGTMNGFFGKFYGFDLYSSNQTAGSAVLSLATQPTANDTVTINGVTFTFVSPIGTTAGNVLIGANVDATRANLATLINAPGTTTATGVALSTANARLFVNATATNSDAADTLTVVFKGVGTLSVSKSLTDATDTWTTTKQKQLCMFGVKGAPTAIIQKEPSIKFKEEPKKHGGNVLNGVLYGVKTFADNAKQLCKVEVDSSSF